MSIESLETGRDQQSVNGTQPMAYIRCAVRLLAITKGIYEMCGLPMAGTPELEEIPELPTWARNVCGQLQLTIFERLMDLRPQGNRADWSNTGRMLGVWQ